MCFDVVYSTDEKIIDLCRSHLMNEFYGGMFYGGIIYL